MSGNGFGGLNSFAKALLDTAQKRNILFLEMTKHITADFLAEVMKRTPVGEGTTATVGDKTVKVSQGGTLRRSWKAGNVENIGEYWTSTVFNPIEYASYVEYGHRQTPGRFVPAIGKKLKRSWVEGQHMMQISAEHTTKRSEEYIKREIGLFLLGRFK